MNYATALTWLTLGLTLALIGYVLFVAGPSSRKSEQDKSKTVKNDVVITSFFATIAVSSGGALLLGVERPLLIPIVGIFASAVPFFLYSSYLMFKRGTLDI